MIGTLLSRFGNIGRFLPLFGYLGILAVIFFPVITAPPGSMVYGLDISGHQYFAKKFLVDSIRGGEIPWWNPYSFSGFPFIAAPQGVNLFYPLSLLFFALPLERAFSWYLIVHIFIAMSGMYALMRRYLPASAAWFAGIAFGMTGFFMPRIFAGHLDIIAAGAYLPWMIAHGLTVSDTKKKTPVLLFVITAYLQITSGYLTMHVFTLIALAVAVVFRCMERRSLQPFLWISAALVGGWLVAAVQLLPQMEFLLRSNRSGATSYRFASTGAMTVSQMPELVYGLVHDYRKTGAAAPFYPEHILYFGCTTVVLAAFALITGIVLLVRRKRFRHAGLVGSSLVLTLFGIWVSLGPNAPVDLQYYLWKYVPFYSSIRIPPRHILLSAFGMSVLAGYGLSSIGNRFVRSMLIAALLLETVPFALHFIRTGPPPTPGTDATLLSILQQASRPVTDTAENQTAAVPTRFYPNYVWASKLGEGIHINSPSLLKIFSASGYETLILGRYLGYFSIFSDVDYFMGLSQMPVIGTDEALVNYLNIGHMLVPYDVKYSTDMESGRLIREYDNAHNYAALYRTVRPYPRFFPVTGSVTAGSDADLLALMKREYDGKTGPQVSRQVYLTENDKTRLQPVDPRCSVPMDAVRITSYRLNSVTLDVSVPCPAYLVSSEVMYPGWYAWVDGKRTPVVSGNLAFRTVVIPAGSHTVTYRFIPVTFIFGGIISFITMVGICTVYRKSGKNVTTGTGQQYSNITI